MRDIVDVMQELVHQPKFWQHLGTSRTIGQPGTYFDSPAFKELNKRTGGELMKRLYGRYINSCYELGVDGVELLHLTNHSALMAFIR